MELVPCHNPRLLILMLRWSIAARCPRRLSPGVLMQPEQKVHTNGSRTFLIQWENIDRVAKSVDEGHRDFGHIHHLKALTFHSPKDRRLSHGQGFKRGQETWVDRRRHMHQSSLGEWLRCMERGQLISTMHGVWAGSCPKKLTRTLPQSFAVIDLMEISSAGPALT